MPTPEPVSPTWVFPIAVAAANEGIPVAAIARILNRPSSEVYDALQSAKDVGSILDMPRNDWPAGVRTEQRVPTTPILSTQDMMFRCQRNFKVTRLEAGFVVALLRHERVDKTKLHNIIEQQRQMRMTQPSEREATDPKMVDVIICKLRTKMKAVDPDYLITTVWGGGYYITKERQVKILEWLNGVAYVEEKNPPGESAGASPAGA